MSLQPALALEPLREAVPGHHDAYLVFCSLYGGQTEGCHFNKELEYHAA